MEEKLIKKLLTEQQGILTSASKVLSESYERVTVILAKKNEALSISEKESCEALTARFARLCDFLFQRVFRTLDRIELLEEGTAIDRLNRMEKRSIISSARLWRELRELRNDIAHEYLIEKSSRVFIEAHKHTPELLATVQKFEEYLQAKKYL